MRAKAPASSANLGPGFDTLALALTLYVEVEVTEADRLVVTAEGEGVELPADATHLAARVAASVVGHDRLAIHVRSEIPVGRGLGSSAALAAAAAAAAGAPDPLAVAAEVDGHPENAAASVAGGLVTATTIEGQAVVTPLLLDANLAFVVLIPDRTLPTKEARAALPSSVPHKDAAFNLGRMGLLLSGLADATRLRPEAMHDRLHQHQRAPLFPEADALLAGLVDAGASASCWSGAGPTLLGVCLRSAAAEVRARGEALLSAHGVAGKALVLEADRQGLTVVA
ncbi:MAG: homoserine kinase [Acidimicrobiaceae bacterium]|nr:homoserine kinase [Acidimicrobiaceae bacterium]